MSQKVQLDKAYVTFMRICSNCIKLSPYSLNCLIEITCWLDQGITIRALSIYVFCQLFV